VIKKSLTRSSQAGFTRSKNFGKVRSVCAMGAIVITVNGCDMLSRFFEETYTCPQQNALAERITFKKPQNGADILFEGNAGNATGEIIDISDDKLTASAPWGTTIIDRNSGKVSFLKANKLIATVSCKKTVFKM